MFRPDDQIYEGAYGIERRGKQQADVRLQLEEGRTDSWFENNQCQGAKRAAGDARVFVLMLVLFMVTRLWVVRFHNDLSSSYVDVEGGSRGRHGGQQVEVYLTRATKVISVVRAYVAWAGKGETERLSP